MLNNTYPERFNQFIDNLKNTPSSRNVSLTCFADGESFLQDQAKVLDSAISSNLVHSFEKWNKPRLKNTHFFHENIRILSERRGAGLWAWKPFIIFELLKKMDDGGILIYTDVGVQTGSSVGTYELLPIYEYLDRNPKNLAVAVLPNYLQRQWTKRDCFERMVCPIGDYGNKNQIQASFIAMKKNEHTYKLVSEWLSYCCDFYCISDYHNISGKLNAHDFVDHRHDQSIFTNLFYKYNFSCPTLPLLDNYQKSIKKFGAILARELCLEATSMNLIHNITATCSQSSFYNDGKKHHAHDLLTQEKTGHYNIHTENEENPTWSCQFNDPIDISEIRIFNRRDNCTDRAKDLQIFVSTQNGNEELIFDNSNSNWDLKSPLILNINKHRVEKVHVTLAHRGILHLDKIEFFK